MLSAIQYLEETQGAGIKVRINNFEFWVPTTWNILVVDKDTYQIDTINIQNCANIKYSAFAFSVNEMKLKTLDILVVDYTEEISLVHPQLQKATALIHPVGNNSGLINEKLYSVVIGPHDLYKYLSNKIIGDLFY